MSEQNNNEEYILVWDAPKIEAPEFRLYYKKDGSVDFYTCDKPEGNHLVVDALVFAEARPDVKVVDGRITKVSPYAIIQKLKPSNAGQLTSASDISIIINPKKITTSWAKNEVQHWELCNYEIE